jgi:plastocyanin
MGSVTLWSLCLFAAAPPGLAGDVAELQREVASQRLLINSLLQDEQRQTSTLLKLYDLMSSGQCRSVADAGVPLAAPAPVAEAGPSEPAAVRPAPPRPVVARYTVTGRVAFKSGGVPADAWVYVRDVEGLARNRALEIIQQNKTFIPAVAVVQAGTKVTFPNFDAIFHDVFSRSPGNSFDIGASQGGDKPRSIVLYQPGLVEVFCNFHARMNAKVLVVPGPLFTKADAEGRFTLPNVPAGRRVLAAWSPQANETTLTLDLSGPQSVSLTLIPTPARPHLNKNGQLYGSYGD